MPIIAGGVGKRAAHIIWYMVKPEKAAAAPVRYLNYLEDNWPCASARVVFFLLAVNDNIDTRLSDLI